MRQARWTFARQYIGLCRVRSAVQLEALQRLKHYSKDMERRGTAERGWWAGPKAVALLLALALTGLSAKAVAVTQMPADLLVASVSAPAPASAANNGDVLAVIGAGSGALVVTKADFERAFRLAVGDLLNRQGLPLREDLLEMFAPSRGQFLEQFIRDKRTEFLARQALPNFKYVGPPRIGPHSFAQPQRYADYLTGAGYVDEADYLQEMARQALLETYRQSLRERVSLSEAAVQSYYALNRRQFMQREEACVRHILLPSQEQARDLRNLLIAGGDFGLLARTQSRDPGSAAKDGDLGCMAPGQTVPAFDTALFGGTVGVPQLVQTDQGWHVLEVTERHQAGPVPPEQAAQRIRQQLAAQAAGRLLEVQLAQVSVQIFP